MIQKGPSFNESFILKKKDGAISVRGIHSARFGYKLGSGQEKTPDGVWAEWAWENGRFELRNDRLGFYPLFYYQDRNGFGVSNDISKLVQSGCSAELDDAAIAVFLRLGFFIGDDTPFKAIRALPPGSVLRWDANGFHLESDGAPPGSRSSSLSRGAAVTQFGELFQAGIERIAAGETGKIALPLSGGRDSRHILFALLKENRPPDACVTVAGLPPKLNEDALIASAVARFDGLIHVVLPHPEDILAVELEKNRLTNFCADEHAWLMPLRRYLRENCFAAVFDGIAGDVLSAGLYLNEGRLRLYAEGKFRELAEELLDAESYRHQMLRAEFREKWGREPALGRLVGELKKYADRPNPVGQFYFWNRTRREISASPWGIMNGPCHVYAPYLSREIYDFLSSLPAAYFLGRTFHDEVIAQQYPGHAHLAYEAKNLPPGRLGRREIVRYARDAARYCLFPGPSPRRVNASFFLPRIAKGFVDADYGTSLPELFNKAVYLRQLDELISERFREPC